MNNTVPDINKMRELIDQKDQNIYDLLIERTNLVTEIGRAKKALSEQGKATHLSLRPGREAKILRHLLRQDSGALPKSVLISIWREMIASFCALQSDFSIAYWGEFEPDAMRDMVRYYFGHTVQIRRCATVTAVLNSVSDGKATIGIVPTPDIVSGQDARWWQNLSSNMSVSGALPFVLSDPASTVKGNYFFVTQVPSEETGDDLFLLNVTTIPDVSRMTIVTYLKQMGYDAKSLSIQDDLDIGSRKHLLEVVGYISSDMFAEFNKKFIEISEDKVLSSQLIGQFPAPYDLKEDEEEEQSINQPLVAPF